VHSAFQATICLAARRSVSNELEQLKRGPLSLFPEPVSPTSSLGDTLSRPDLHRFLIFKRPAPVACFSPRLTFAARLSPACMQQTGDCIQSNCTRESAHESLAYEAAKH